MEDLSSPEGLVYDKVRPGYMMKFHLRKDGETSAREGCFEIGVLAFKKRFTKEIFC